MRRSQILKFMRFRTPHPRRVICVSPERLAVYELNLSQYSLLLTILQREK